MTTSNLTPELLDLMQDEKVIEQGLTTFVEVGQALARIRDGKKYRALGHKTFEAYVAERWQMSRSRAHRLIDAAAVAEMLPMGDISETASERSLRPLAPLAKSDPDGAREAWAEAVKQADGGQPTAAQVREAVERRRPPRRDHPAPFSDPILDTIAEHVKGAEVVLDPFAGTGRVHELRDRAGVGRTIGVEIEPEWAAKHPDTIQGDALDLGAAGIEPESVDAIATSPTYGNRMADHHEATDDSVRLTYKHTLGRDLSDNNSGQFQWGPVYREFHREAWRQATAALRPGGTFTVNVKNHIRNGEVQRVVEWHLNTLMHEFRLELVAFDAIPTRGLMAGANNETRTGFEYVITLRKSGAVASAA